jgi:hypothetical protein
MTLSTPELEKEVQRLSIKLTLIEHALMSNASLPILGPEDNWDKYKEQLDRAMARAGL